MKTEALKLIDNGADIHCLDQVLFLNTNKKNYNFKYLFSVQYDTCLQKLCNIWFIHISNLYILSHKEEKSFAYHIDKIYFKFTIDHNRKYKYFAL